MFGRFDGKFKALSCFGRNESFPGTAGVYQDSHHQLCVDLELTLELLEPMLELLDCLEPLLMES